MALSPGLEGPTSHWEVGLGVVTGTVTQQAGPALSDDAGAARYRDDMGARPERHVEKRCRIASENW